MATAAFSGDLPNVLTEAARRTATTVGNGIVTVGVIASGDLDLRVWEVEDSMLGDVVRRTVSLDALEPVAEAARTGRPITNGQSHNEARIPVQFAAPFSANGKPTGVVGVLTEDPSTQVSPDAILGIAAQTALAIEHIRLRKRTSAALQETVTVLAALVEGRDAYTESHCVHLAEASLAVGMRMGLSAERLDLLTFGGLLHDIGKIAIPDAILSKPGPLDEGEYAKMKTHAAIGERVLGRITSLDNVAPIVGQHHERFDGNGYPRGLRGEEILLEARILAVVDAFDAMTTTRPYRQALPWSRAVDEIQSGKERQFDPDAVETFLRYLDGEEAQWRTSGPI